MVVAPHTSNYDFFIGVMARSILKLNFVKFLGKSQLFKPPHGFIFRWLGGTPVDRTQYNNLVDAVVALFNQNERFAIALAPEGTRKKVPRLKTGFYYIAKGAQVPILMVAFDYGTKTVRFAEPFLPTDSIENDFKKIIKFFSQSQGYNPELGFDPDLFETMKGELEGN